MQFVDEFRDQAAVIAAIQAIRLRASRRWTLMEVCGGQTHALLKSGIADELEDLIELLHGPGCPVCVTSTERIDAAIGLAQRPGVLLTAFGDMFRVPGSQMSLAGARSAGAAVRPVYSPLDALAWAQRNPRQEVVFFAVGFETTAPATALAVLQAERLGIKNFSVLAAHVCVQPAMEAILGAPDNRVQAFLAAGHVCAVVGYRQYAELAARYHTPIVVTGFEPYDLTIGLLACIEQLESGRCDVQNCYPRVVAEDGNPSALRIVSQVYETCDRDWRGFGLLRGGGLRIRPDYAEFDAERRFAMPAEKAEEPGRCRGGEVLSGRIKPTACAAFGIECTPDRPLGAPMVSSEGACAAYFHYRGLRLPHSAAPRQVQS